VSGGAKTILDAAGTHGTGGPLFAAPSLQNYCIRSAKTIDAAHLAGAEIRRKVAFGF